MKGGITRVQNEITTCIAELNDTLNEFHTLRTIVCRRKNNYDIYVNYLRQNPPRSNLKALFIWIRMKRIETVSSIAMIDEDIYKLEDIIYELEIVNEEHMSHLELMNLVDFVIM